MIGFAHAAPGGEAGRSVVRAVSGPELGTGQPGVEVTQLEGDVRGSNVGSGSCHCPFLLGGAGEEGRASP